MTTRKTIATTGLELKEVASLIGGELLGDESPIIKDVASTKDAGAGDITFATCKRTLSAACKSRASAIIAPLGSEAVEGKTLLLVEKPALAFALVVDLIRPLIHLASGIDAQASIDPTAVIGKAASIGACVVIESNVTIGKDAVIYPGVFIGKDCSVAEGAVIYPNVSIMEKTIIGKNVTIHAGSVIGSDGFGYTKDNAKYLKIPQRGHVVICDDVEIGANVTIDRATIGATTIGRGTKIDNLVQIAHNVIIGEDTVIIAQVGISGSTKIGNRVIIAGQSGLAGHIVVVDDCVIGAKAGVTGNIKEKGIYSGFPLMAHQKWLRTQGAVNKLLDMRKKINELEKRLEKIETSQSK